MRTQPPLSHCLWLFCSNGIFFFHLFEGLKGMVDNSVAIHKDIFSQAASAKGEFRLQIIPQYHHVTVTILLETILKLSSVY